MCDGAESPVDFVCFRVRGAEREGDAGAPAALGVAGMDQEGGAGRGEDGARVVGEGEGGCAESGGFGAGR